MGRDIVDIPEVFRDAFDEDEWGGERGGEGGNGGDGNGGRGDGRAFGRPWWLNRWVAFGLLAIPPLSRAYRATMGG